MRELDRWDVLIIALLITVFAAVVMTGCAQLRDPSGIKAGSTGDITITSQGAVAFIVFASIVLIVVIGTMAIMCVRIVKWVHGKGE
jgi:hypothetical protein